jgi:glucose-6-phosphate-specific signal transduction histidine kinase
MLSVKKISIIFDKEIKDRKKFIDVYIQIIKATLLDETEVNFIRPIMEIVKNIYDHANGEGELILKKINEESLYFEIFDYGNNYYILEKLKHDGISTLASAKNAHNFDFGLSKILEFGQKLCQNFEVKTSKGFYYSGIYSTKKHLSS